MANRGNSSRERGAKYEELAAEYLQKQGFQILQRNFSSRFGEIDLIAREGRYLVFVEVKYRKDISCGYPEEAVSARKQQRIRHTASWYLYRHGYGEDLPCRFDVVSITGEKISLIRDAF